MSGVQWQPNIIAEAREIAQRSAPEAFPVPLKDARGIFVTTIDDPTVAAGAAFVLDGKTFKLGPKFDT